MLILVTTSVRSMMGYIYPPETGEYIFALASDDNGALWLSTDESPANAKLIASQGGWQPVRDYRAETTSSEIFLEAGQMCTLLRHRCE